jgi:ADP-heptose:LPS heptosyltransferase
MKASLKPSARILVIRMSSLGDLILATSFLENLPEHTQVDWIVRSDFEFALKGHPKIRKLISYSKKTGLTGWLRLVQSLRNEPYVARVDLHRSLRSRIAFLMFRIQDLTKFRRIRHFRISKERLRTGIYFLLKAATPQLILPTPYWLRFGRLAKKLLPSRASDGTALLPPSYLPILQASGHDERHVLSEYDLFPGKYFVVMPAASFRTKEWSPVCYRELIQSHFSGQTPVIVGRESDLACRELRAELKRAKIFYKDALSEPDFKKTAILLKHSQFYVGSDTGLAHLAEAVGTQSFVIFGPTRPDLGFGPWRAESKKIFLPLACSPCSKDGKFCYRFFSPYACLKELKVSEVKRQIIPS